MHEREKKKNPLKQDSINNMKRGRKYERKERGRDKEDKYITAR